MEVMKPGASMPLPPSMNMSSVTAKPSVDLAGSRAGGSCESGNKQESGPAGLFIPLIVFSRLIMAASIGIAYCLSRVLSLRFFQR